MLLLIPRLIPNWKHHSLLPWESSRLSFPVTGIMQPITCGQVWSPVIVGDLG